MHIHTPPSRFPIFQRVLVKCQRLITSLAGQMSTADHVSPTEIIHTHIHISTFPCTLYMYVHTPTWRFPDFWTRAGLMPSADYVSPAEKSESTPANLAGRVRYLAGDSTLLKAGIEIGTLFGPGFYHRVRVCWKHVILGWKILDPHVWRLPRRLRLVRACLHGPLLYVCMYMCIMCVCLCHGIDI